MGVKLCLILLILAASAVPHFAGFINDGIHGLGRFHNEDAVFAPGSSLVGDSRNLLQRGKYLSYAALKKDIIPCGKHGRSYYYACTRRRRANPYKRSCLAITGCARFTD